MLLQSVTKVPNVVTKCYKVSQNCQILLQSVTNCCKSAKYLKGVKCSYKLLQSVTKLSNVATKWCKVLQKCQMLLQSAIKSYKSFKC